MYQFFLELSWYLTNFCIFCGRHREYESDDEMMCPSQILQRKQRFLHESDGDDDDFSTKSDGGDDDLSMNSMAMMTISPRNWTAATTVSPRI
jgi:hypothetical protein